MQSILAIPLDLQSSQLSLTGAQPLIAGSLANLVSNRYGQVARWAGIAGTTYDFFIDLGVAKTADTIALLWHNLRAADTVQIYVGSSFGGAELGAFTANTLFTTSYATSAGMKTLHVLAAPITARYWRIRMTVNTTNLPEGYLQLSRISLANRIVLGVDYTQLDTLDDDRGSIDRSDYGEDIEDQRRISFGLRPRWRFATEAEQLSFLHQLTLRGNTRPIIFAPFDNTHTNAMDFIAFGKMRNASKSSSSTYNIWETSFDIYSEAA